MAVRVSAESLEVNARPARIGTSIVVKYSGSIDPRSALSARAPATSADTCSSGPDPRKGTEVAAATAATPGICFTTSRMRGVGTPPLFSTRIAISGCV